MLIKYKVCGNTHREKIRDNKKEIEAKLTELEILGTNHK